MENSIINRIRKELIKNIDEKNKKSFARFFKEKVKYYGVPVAKVNKIAKQYFEQVKSSSKKEIFELSEELLKSDYTEEAFIVSDWIYKIEDRFEKDDFYIFERWIQKYINNWAKCDSFCNHAFASFIEQFPKYLDNLKEWTKSENKWVRRASAVTLILPARNGKFKKEIFEIADFLLKDKDDIVQKGYGWMLKEASKAYQKEVFDYVMKNKNKMPRTALRYAIEKMPEELRKKAMEK